MRTIALVSAKGGGGKTTLAASLAVAAMEAGERPFLIDMDPQASLIAWGNRRTADLPPVDSIEWKRLSAALAGLEREGYTLAIVDTWGIDGASTTEAMRAADLTLVPARPSAIDVMANTPTVAALARLERPYALILNACTPGWTARVAEACAALSKLGPLVPRPIVARTDHMDAVAAGLGVTEYSIAGRAAEEVRELWGWVAQRLKIKEKPDVQETAVA
jgi:chromosome partitioning protein